MRNRFRDGDRDAFGELYDLHARVLYRYALRVTGDWAAAEDVVSTTFLEAWRSRERLQPDAGDLRPWLLGIATNVIRGNARSRRRRHEALARMPERDAVPDFSDEVLGRIDDAERLRAARAALERLRRREREVFTLVVWAGLDYAAAAEALGVPVGTVRSRLSRARARLSDLADAELRAERGRFARLRGGRRTAAKPAPTAPPHGASDSAAAPSETDMERVPRSGKPVTGRFPAARSTQENQA
ncbi:RNA polymerase sigma factor [Yinghuangia seranimata]|uniref:RNA polymerase sigma factor n=1 Tax=Yinghuangia seranimata TaxID=408067 RepID=UPI00248BFADE|nr:RNA polymerase sigma factor [Yinghuangia seranimata]MDI2130642.1 RNA polymerase sigma factor [Yinghuangia seranimata]